MNSSSSLEENKQRQDDQHEVIICAACSKPLFSFESILSDKIDVFSKAVYTYQIEDVLPDHGIEGGCHLYSATNPGAKRFDVFRVKTAVSDGKDDEPQVPWNYQLTIQCENRKYTDLHTWFPGYSWCMTVCGHCHTHIGWGFSPIDPGDDLQADGMDDEDEDDEEEEDDDEEEEQAEEENKKRDKKPKKNRQRPPRNIRDPTFIGIIFGHIRARSMPVPEWQRHLQHLSSVSVEIRLDLLRSAWPILHDQFRTAILTLLFQLRRKFLQKQNSIEIVANRFQPSAAITLCRNFFSVMESRDIQFSLLNAAAYIERRKRRRVEEGEANSAAIDREVIRIPFFRSTLTEQEEEYLVEPNEDEDFLDTLDSRELFVEWNRAVGNHHPSKGSTAEDDEIMKEWDSAVEGTKTRQNDEDATARTQNRRGVVGAIMILNFYERWRDQYLLEDGKMKISLERRANDQEQDEDEENFDDMLFDDEEEQEEENDVRENDNANDQRGDENEQGLAELPLIQVPNNEMEQPSSTAPRTREIHPLWKFLLITMIPELEILLC